MRMNDEPRSSRNQSCLCMDPGIELVADTVDGLNVAWLPGEWLYFLPKTVDVDIDVALEPIEIVSEGAFDELASRERLTRRLQHRLKKTEFGWCQRDLIASN